MRERLNDALAISDEMGTWGACGAILGASLGFALAMGPYDVPVGPGTFVFASVGVALGIFTAAFKS